MPEAGNDPGGDGVADIQDDDWNRRGCALRRTRSRSPVGHDHVDLLTDKFGRERGELVVFLVGPAERDDEGLAFDVSEIPKAGSECLDTACKDRGGGRPEKSDSGRRLLRARRDRPGGCRAADEGDELAPSQVIEVHFGPAPPIRIAGYRVGEEQPAGSRPERKLARAAAPVPPARP